MLWTRSHPPQNPDRSISPRTLDRRKAAGRLDVEQLEERCLLSVTLLQDINTDTLNSDPESVVDVNGTAFFVADDGIHGRELWKSDGTPEGTAIVRDFNPGRLDTFSRSGSPTLLSANGLVFFVAGLGLAPGLWRSDGTEDGTFLLKAGGGSRLANVDDNVFFLLAGTFPTIELWKTDGTLEGTVAVKELARGPSGEFPDEFVEMNGRLFFRSYDASNGLELWTSDGTTQGTRLVTDINPGSASSFLSGLTNFNGTLLFRAFVPQSGTELWKSDGTAEGTVLVKDITPGPNSSFFSIFDPPFTVVDQKMFFVADDGIHGKELWVTDGAEAGTQLVKDISPPTFTNGTRNFAVANGLLFFTDMDQAHGEEIWRSDGTEAGTVLIKDINPGPFSSIPQPGIQPFPSFTAGVGDLVFFSANDGVHGGELWKTDGTEAGTVLVRDLTPGGLGVSHLAVVDGTLYFRASRPELGTELWKSDGTENGTLLVKDINTVTAGILSVGGSASLTAARQTLYFTPYERTLGRTLWKSNGTRDGTERVRDFGTLSLGSFQDQLTDVNGTLFFRGFDAATPFTLWKSDGTAAGTVPVVNNPLAFRSPRNLINVNGTLFFFAFTQAGRFALCTSDGTEDGTVVVRNFGVSANPDPYNMTAVNHLVFFTVYLSSSRYELWRSDGTEAGTFPIATHNQVGFAPAGLTEVNGTLFFAGSNALWRTNGTVAGTVRLRDFSFSPRNAVNVNGTLFFFAASGSLSGLWKSNGTAAGTVFVSAIAPGDVTLEISNLTAVGGTLFFSAATLLNGSRLWKSDGTASGTVPVRTINPTSRIANFRNFTTVNGRLFFVADDGLRGTELWKSDGTEAGTVLVEDIFPGPFSSGPANLTVVDERLFFTADDGIHGLEVWELDVPSFVEQVIINDGSAQRSRVTRITVNFLGTVTFDPGAFEVRQQGGGRVDLLVATTVVGNRTVAVLTFTGPDILGGSLADGNYTLTIRSDRVHGRSVNLDGDGDGEAGGDRVDAFFRYFGDSDGDRSVDAFDFRSFVASFGRLPGDPQYRDYFDFNGDGFVDIEDLQPFIQRLGTSLAP